MGDDDDDDGIVVVVVVGEEWKEREIDGAFNFLASRSEDTHTNVHLGLLHLSHLFVDEDGVVP